MSDHTVVVENFNNMLGELRGLGFKKLCNFSQRIIVEINPKVSVIYCNINRLL